MNWASRAESALAGVDLTREEGLELLHSHDDELLELLHGAFLIRRHHFGRKVRLHVLHSARTGACAEDCSYCAQSSSSTPPAPAHPWHSPDSIVLGALLAAEKEAVRYCVVSSGRGPSEADLDFVCQVAGKIKAQSPIQLCVSLGLLEAPMARRLKNAGVDRYNHNLESSAAFFPRTCTTHLYEDRLATARAAKEAGLELCSGGILGVGETLEDRVSLAFELKKVDADSIPINLHDPRPGSRFESLPRLRPSDALRALALFRYVHPSKEIRIAGGREACLGPLQALALYPANSMFTEGYLTTSGQGKDADRQLLETAGFSVEHWTQA
jgi:biotin synthase